MNASVPSGLYTLSRVVLIVISWDFSQFSLVNSTCVLSTVRNGDLVTLKSKRSVDAGLLLSFTPNVLLSPSFTVSGSFCVSNVP